MPNQDDGTAPGMYRMSLTPADVGRRVVLRRRLTDGREGLGDVVGDLLSWTDGELVVRVRDGREICVTEDTVVAGKLVPPAPSR